MQTETDVLRATPEVNFWLHLYCEIYFAPSQRGGRVFHTRHPKPTTITAELESRPANHPHRDGWVSIPDGTTIPPGINPLLKTCKSVETDSV
jgi:hypothetical protein